MAVRHRRRVHGLRGGRARPVRAGQGAPEALREIQRSLNERVGEGRARDRHRRLGLLRRQLQRGQHRRDGQVPEHGRAVWRWTGDDRSATRSTTSRRATCGTSSPRSTPTTTAGPRASATSSARAWGRRSSTTPSTSSAGSTTWPTWRAAKRDRATARWAKGLGDTLRARFDPAWWDEPTASTRTRSPRPTAHPAEALDRRHADGDRADRRRRAVPGLAPGAHGATALAERETDCYSGTRRSTPACSTRAAAGGPRARASGPSSRSTPRSRPSARATTAARPSAVHRRQRGADVRCPTSSPARCRRSCLRRTAPEREHRPLLDAAARWSSRPGATTARRGRSIHQQLGVRPSLGTGRLDVVPQVPEGQPSVAGRNIRLGDGTVDVRAERALDDGDRADAPA